MPKTVNWCPFCGENSPECVSKQTIHNSDSPEPDEDEVIYTYYCEDCGEMFQTSKYGCDTEEKDFFKCFGDARKISEDCEECTDDDDKEECKCAAPAAEWYERRYYETLRELEKTRYLLDLTIKEGMRRE